MFGIGALAFLANPWVRKGLAILGILGILGIAAVWFIHHERSIGAAKIEAAVKAATEAEQARQSTINQEWQNWADGANHNADQQKAGYDELQRQLALSTANDHRLSLPRNVARRLRPIGQSSGQANPATGTGTHPR